MVQDVRSIKASTGGRKSNGDEMRLLEVFS